MLLRCFSLIHGDLGAELLHGGNDLLGVLLGHVLLHHLGRALNKLLGLDQAQAKQVLDLLDDLGLGASIKLLELEGEERLLGGGRGSLLGLFDNGGGTGGSGSEAANGEIGNVELRLWAGLLACACSYRTVVWARRHHSQGAVPV